MLGFGGDGFRDHERGGPIRALLRAPLWLLRGVWRVVSFPLAGLKLVRVGWGGRQGRHLVQGLPALAGLLVVAFLAAAVGVSRASLPERYRAAAVDAAADGDLDLALTLYERLARLDGGRGGTAFERAQLLSRAGRDAEATSMMQALTGRRPPEPRAHVWLAERLIGGPGVTLDDALRPVPPAGPAAAPGGDERPADAAAGYRPEARQVAAAAGHLNAALRTGLADAPRVHGRLAEILLLFGRKDEAVEHLKAQSEGDPDRLLAYARLLDDLGRTVPAEAAYRQAAAHFGEVVRDDPADSLARRRLAVALLKSGSPAAAREALERGLRGTPDPVARRMLAELLTIEVRELGVLRADEALPKLRQALVLAPTYAPALAELAKMAAQGDPAADAALDDMLTGGEANGAVHLAAGLRASARGDDGAALFHFRRAYELDRSLVFAANNLAFLLARGADPQPEKALAVMDGVVAEFPDVANFRDTRGGILMLLGRTEEAVAELERALAGGMAGNRGLHLALAKGYEELGQPALAAAHRRRVLDAERNGEPAGESVRIPPTAADPAPADLTPAGAAPADAGRS